jgi:hypothetical protein
MSYQLLIERDRPIVYNTFDNATNTSHSLVAGGGSSAIVTTTPFTHTFPRWSQGEFTAEIWFKPLSTNVVTVLGHDDDGLIYDGVNKTISFTVKQSDNTFVTTTQKASSKVMYLVAQYTGYSIILMVNGVQSSALTTLPLKETGGLKSGGGKMSIDALAMYDYLLNDDTMYRHFYNGVAFPLIDDVYTNAENYFQLIDANETILDSVSFPDWSQGYADGVVVDSDDRLVNDINITNGKWYTNVMVPDDQRIKGSKLEYDFAGTEPQVSVSIDGVNWQAAQNHYSLPAVPYDATLPGIDPLLRVSLAADTELISLRVVIYGNNLSAGNSGNRSIEMTRPATSATEQSYVYEQDDSAGAWVGSGGLKVTADTSEDSKNIQAISYWYKGPAQSTGIINGGLFAHVDGQWNFCVRNFANPRNQNETIVANYNGQITNVVTWTSTQDAAALYNSHFMKPTIYVSEVNRIRLYEPTDGVKVYQKNWIVL